MGDEHPHPEVMALVFRDMRSRGLVVLEDGPGHLKVLPRGGTPKTSASRTLLLPVAERDTISFSAGHRLARDGTRRWLLDHPNERSLHHQPTTRSGGLAIALGILIGGIATGYLGAGFDQLSWLALGALIVFIVSFRDDLSHVHPAIRISVHFFVALILVFAGYAVDAVDLPGLRWPLVSWLGVVISCLYVVWMTLKLHVNWT